MTQQFDPFGPDAGPQMFSDRTEAGQRLARALQPLQLRDPVVLALPRGGVPVALEIARALGAPLDLLLVRKIGAPWQPELAVAAVAEGSPPFLEVYEESLRMSGADPGYVEREAQIQLREIERRRVAYLRGRAPVPVEGRTAVVVDDGIATGTTLRAALKALRTRKPAQVVLAVPVASPRTVAQFETEVDRIVCLSQPPRFQAVGMHYDDFHQVSDAEVIAMLDAAVSGGTAPPAS